LAQQQQAEEQNDDDDERLSMDDDGRYSDMSDSTDEGDIAAFRSLQLNGERDASDRSFGDDSVGLESEAVDDDEE
jgi:hypothetical protein